MSHIDSSTQPCTLEEIEAKQRKRQERLEKFFNALRSDMCPRCGQSMQQKVQIGQSVYADPCGCRLYTGQIKKVEEKQ